MAFEYEGLELVASVIDQNKNSTRVLYSVLLFTIILIPVVYEYEELE